MAKISELFVRQGSVEVEGTIKEIGEVRTFDRYGRQLRVADAILEDETGTIKLSLWNDDIDKYKSGDKVRIINGYVGEFQGEKQLTSGKFGKIEKIGEGKVEEGVEEKSEVSADDKSLEDAPVEEDKEAEESEEPEGVEANEEEL